MTSAVGISLLRASTAKLDIAHPRSRKEFRRCPHGRRRFLFSAREPLQRAAPRKTHPLAHPAKFPVLTDRRALPPRLRIAGSRCATIRPRPVGRSSHAGRRLLPSSAGMRRQAFCPSN